MAKTKQTARRSAVGKTPRKHLATKAAAVKAPRKRRKRDDVAASPIVTATPTAAVAATPTAAVATAAAAITTATGPKKRKHWPKAEKKAAIIYYKNELSRPSPKPKNVIVDELGCSQSMMYRWLQEECGLCKSQHSKKKKSLSCSTKQCTMTLCASCVVKLLMKRMIKREKFDLDTEVKCEFCCNIGYSKLYQIDLCQTMIRTFIPSELKELKEFLTSKMETLHNRRAKVKDILENKDLVPWDDDELKKMTKFVDLLDVSVGEDKMMGISFSIKWIRAQDEIMGRTVDTGLLEPFILQLDKMKDQQAGIKEVMMDLGVKCFERLVFIETMGGSHLDLDGVAPRVWNRRIQKLLDKLYTFHVGREEDKKRSTVKVAEARKTKEADKLKRATKAKEMERAKELKCSQRLEQFYEQKWKKEHSDSGSQVPLEEYLAKRKAEVDLEKSKIAAEAKRNVESDLEKSKIAAEVAATEAQEVEVIEIND